MPGVTGHRKRLNQVTISRRNGYFTLMSTVGLFTIAKIWNNVGLHQWMNGRKGDILYTYYICICIYTHIHICVCILEYYSVTKRRNPAICDNMDNLGHLDTHRQGWVSLLWGHRFFLLGPGAHRVLFVPSKSLFPQSCVSYGGSMVGLTATSSKTAYAIPNSAAPRAPAPASGHC